MFMLKESNLLKLESLLQRDTIFMKIIAQEEHD